METDKGGWIVIQRRVPNGTVNFYRGWKDYEKGFGDLDSEFWYGLRNIYLMAWSKEHTQPMCQTLFSDFSRVWLRDYFETVLVL